MKESTRKLMAALKLRSPAALQARLAHLRRKLAMKGVTL